MEAHLRLIAAALFFAPICIGAQPVRAAGIADSSASAAISQLRMQGSAGAPSAWRANIMRGVGHDQPAQKLDQIADALADAVVVGSRNPQLTGGLEPGAAFEGLMSAGLMGDGVGTPYAGVLARLIRIHQDATDSYSHRALRKMTSVSGRGQALQYLRRIATQTDGSAAVAISVLADDINGGPLGGRTAGERDEAIAVLRELYLSNAVRESTALSQIRAIANHFGWNRRG
jgi:hypothetical protein